MDLRVSHALGLVAKLARTVADFARQEAELAGTLSAANYREIRRHREAAGKVDTALAAQIAEVEAVSAKEAERVQAIHGRRLGRAQRAHGLLTRTLPKRGADAKGNWLAKLQMRKLHADRSLAAVHRQNDGGHAALSQTLSQQRAALDALTAQTVKAFSGYSAFAQTLVEREGEPQGGDVPEDSPGELQARITAATEQLAKFRTLPLPRLFSAMPLAVCIVLALVAGGVVVCGRGFSPPLYAAGAITGVLLATACVIAYARGAKGGRDGAARTGAAILDAYRVLRACIAAADLHHREERTRLLAEYESTCADIETKWAAADSVEAEFEKKGRLKLEPQLPRMAQKMEVRIRRQLAEIRARTDAKLKEFESGVAEKRRQLDAAHQAEMSVILANEKARWDKLGVAWKAEITPIFEEVAGLNAALAPDFPEWSAAFVESWKAAGHFTPATKFARLTLDLAKRADASTAVSRLALPGSPQVSIPLALTYPQQGSLLFETRESCGDRKSVV